MLVRLRLEDMKKLFNPENDAIDYVTADRAAMQWLRDEWDIDFDKESLEAGVAIGLQIAIGHRILKGYSAVTEPYEASYLTWLNGTINTKTVHDQLVDDQPKPNITAQQKVLIEE